MSLHHVGVTVRDLAVEVEFYTQLLGVKPSVRSLYQSAYTSAQVGYEGAILDVAIFQIPESSVLLELIQYISPAGTPVDIETKNPGTWHLCLQTADLQVEFDRMVGLGATPRSDGPVLITSGANTGRRVAYFRDPEGLTIEMLETQTESRRL